MNNICSVCAAIPGIIGIETNAVGADNGAMNRFLFLPALMALLFLSACAGGPGMDDDGPLTPMPGYMPQDPEDHVLDEAVQTYLAKAGGPASSRYDFTRVDLDGDQRRDALVMMKAPHHYWCDMNGCSIVVFHAADNSFSPVSEIFPVRGPMYVSEDVTQGWRDLIIRVSGQSYARAKDVALNFDGTAYPRNPFFQPAVHLSQADHGQRIFP